MSRRTRHIHAAPDEWIVVRRDPPNSGGGAGCLVLLLILLIPGCAESILSGPIGWFLGFCVVAWISSLFIRI
jgi:hypothetical protein